MTDIALWKLRLKYFNITKNGFSKEKPFFCENTRLIFGWDYDKMISSERKSMNNL